MRARGHPSKIEIEHHPPSQERSMPRMLVTTEPMDRTGTEVMLDERIATSDLDSDHFRTQLVERIGWALADAETLERRPREARQAMRS
jgi:hypothetical protein